jgi:hypothetical protein
MNDQITGGGIPVTVGNLIQSEDQGGRALLTYLFPEV